MRNKKVALTEKITHQRGNMTVLGSIDEQRVCYQCKETRNILQYSTVNKDNFGRAFTKKICNPCVRENQKIIRRLRNLYEPMKPDHCMLCENPSDVLEVDHCHITGQFRGWLCKNCNTGLGKFFDDSQFLIKAIEYLHKDPVPIPEQQQLTLPLEEPSNEME